MDEKDIYGINLKTKIRKISYENVFEKYLIYINNSYNLF